MFPETTPAEAEPSGITRVIDSDDECSITIPQLSHRIRSVWSIAQLLVLGSGSLYRTFGLVWQFIPDFGQLMNCRHPYCARAMISIVTGRTYSTAAIW